MGNHCILLNVMKGWLLRKALNLTTQVSAVCLFAGISQYVLTFYQERELLATFTVVF